MRVGTIQVDPHATSEPGAVEVELHPATNIAEQSIEDPGSARSVRLHAGDRRYSHCGLARLGLCSSLAAGLATTQISAPTGRTRDAGASLSPARIARKMAAFSRPVTRKATRRL